MLAALSFLAFGGLCNGVDDDTQAWADAVAAAKWAPDRVIELPAGACVFRSQPAPLNHGTSVIGQGHSNTRLVADYDGSTLELKGSGSNVSKLTLWKAKGHTGGWGLYCVARNHEECSNHVIEDVWITGEGTYYEAIHIDGGSYRTAPPLGARTIALRNVSAFNATGPYAVMLWGTVGLEWFGGGVYQGFGSGQTVLVGGPNSARNRIDANVGNLITYPGALR